MLVDHHDVARAAGDVDQSSGDVLDRDREVVRALAVAERRMDIRRLGVDEMGLDRLATSPGNVKGTSLLPAAWGNPIAALPSAPLTFDINSIPTGSFLSIFRHPPLDGDSLRRANAALARIAHDPEPLDPVDARSRLDSALAMIA